jgi:NAD(P)-dependent dehydrogenase (short-subunit alcohol dehydrogenase family)
MLMCWCVCTALRFAWLRDLRRLWHPAQVNNAAAFVFGKVEDVTEKQWNDVLDVNVKGYAYMMKHSIPAMRRGARGGSIVNLSSISSTRGQAGMTPYNASKGAILVGLRAPELSCLWSPAGSFV